MFLLMLLTEFNQDGEACGPSKSVPSRCQGDNLLARLHHWPIEMLLLLLPLEIDRRHL